jgi:hypothetical protein
MTRCETCGNEYARPIAVTIGGQSHNYDSFECAIHALAPTCHHCGIRVLGHGVENSEHIYCCASCARAGGARGLVDHL